MKLKKLLIFLVALIPVMSLLFTGCGSSKGKENARTEKKHLVFTSFYPLYYFAQKIGGDRVEVINIMPPGAEPHDWEPGPQMLGALYKADLLIINGFGLEPWVEKIADSLGSNLKVINASEGIIPLTGYVGHYHDDDDHECDHDHNDEDESSDESGIPDPHVWLDPLLALHQAERIAEALIALDPEHADIYRANLAQFREQAQALDLAFRSALSQARQPYFIVTHLSFAYLADRYNLTQVGISGLSPHVEPSPAQMKELIDLARKQQIRYVFQEPLSTGRLATVLASEIGAQILILNPLEGLTEKEEADREDYFSIMEKNMEQLKKAFME